MSPILRHVPLVDNLKALTQQPWLRGRLSARLPAWQRITSDELVLSTVAHGWSPRFRNCSNTSCQQRRHPRYNLAPLPTPFAPDAAAPGPSLHLGRTTKPTSPRSHTRITRNSSTTRSQTCATAASPVAATLLRCPSSRPWSSTSNQMAKSAYSTRDAT